MIRTGQPLVVWRGVKVCKGCGHEVTLVTDGHRAFATSGDHDCETINHVGTPVEVTCGYVDTVADEPCPGPPVKFYLTDPRWTQATDTVSRLLAEAPPMLHEPILRSV